MKKVLLGFTFALLVQNSFAAEECTINYHANDELSDQIQEDGFSFENYDEVCELLEKAKASVSINYNSSITNNQTIAAVFIRVKDSDKPIYSTYTNSNMDWSSTRTTAEEKELVWSLVNSTISEINQSDLDGLNENRKELRVPVYPTVSKKF